MKNAYIIFIVTCLVSIPLLSTDIYVSSLPIIMGFFKTTEFTIKLSLSLYMVGFSLSTFFSAYLCNFVSKYKIILAGLIIFSLSTFFVIITNSINVFLLERTLQGFGAGVGTVVARLILSDRLIATKKMNLLKALSIVGSGMTLSPLLAPLLGAALTYFLGWKAIFCLLGAFSLIMLILIGTLQKDDKVNFHNKAKISNDIHYIIEIVKNKIFLYPLIAIGLACSSEFIFISNSSTFYQNILNLNIFIYSLILSSVLLSFLIGSYILNKLINTFTENVIINCISKVVMIGSILSFTSYFLFSLKICTLIFTINMIIVMIAVGIIVPLTQKIIIDLGKKHGYTIVGLFFFGELLMMAFSGYLVSLSSLYLLSMILGILFCWMLLCIVNYYMLKIGSKDECHG